MFRHLLKKCIVGSASRSIDFRLECGITSYSKVNRFQYQDLLNRDNYRNRTISYDDSSIDNKLIDIDIKNLSSLDHGEFLDVLKNAFIDKPKFLNEHKKVLLKKECFRRQPFFDNISTFYCADILKKSELYFDDYINAVSKTLMFRWDDLILTKEDVLLFALYMSNSTSTTIIPVMDKIEKYLRENINTTDFEPREVGLICHLFFSTNNRIKEFETLNNLAMYILDNISNIEKFYFADLNNMIKVLRHAHYNNVPFFMQLGHNLCNGFLRNSNSFTHLSNLAFTYASLHIQHDHLLDKVTRIFCNKLENLEYGSPNGNETQHEPRLKDFTRLLWARSTFCLDAPEDLKAYVLNLLKSDLTHASKYPETFIESLTTLAIDGTYDKELLRFTFSPNFIKFKQGRMLEQNYQMLLLRSASSIEGGFDEALHPVSQRFLDSLDLCNKDFREHDIKHRKGLHATLDTIHKLLGDWSLFKVHAILNFSKIMDIELHVDKFGKPLKLNNPSHDVIELEGSQTVNKPNQVSILQEVLNSLKQTNESTSLKYESIHLKQESPKYPKKICIKVFGKNQYAINVPTLNGHHELELRLLHKSGYEVYAIDPETAANLASATAEERVKVLKDILFKCGVNI